MGSEDSGPNNELESAILACSQLIFAVEALKEDDRFRGRPLSLAFTELEVAEMWLSRALSDYDEGIIDR